MPIYRKGEDQMGLQQRAVQQSIDEMSATRGMSSSQKFTREVANGVQGAKNAVNLKTTAKEATEHPDTLGGAVSGAALAKLKDKKVSDKKTSDREKKRR